MTKCKSNTFNAKYKTLTFQTVLMMFIKVKLEALVFPNVLMLKAPSSREAERCSWVKNRLRVHTKRILDTENLISVLDIVLHVGHT